TGSKFDVLRSYRLEDFLNVASNPDPAQRVVNQRSGANVSFVVGASANLALDSATLLSDRAEAIPRRLQILLQDHDEVFNDRASFKSSAYAVALDSSASPNPDGEFEILKATIARDASHPYVGQRVTVENMSLDMRWSADAYASAPATITGIVARAGDRLRVIRNDKTYGVISLFGFGIGVYDLNAIESNDDPHRPASYQPIREQIRITAAVDRAECHNPTPPPYVPPATEIPNLTFSPEAVIIPHDGTPDLSVYAVDAARGVLDLTIHPPVSAAE